MFRYQSHSRNSKIPKSKVQLRHAEFGPAGISSFDDLMKKGGYEYSRSADKAGCCSCSSWVQIELCTEKVGTG